MRLHNFMMRPHNNNCATAYQAPKRSRTRWRSTLPVELRGRASVNTDRLRDLVARQARAEMLQHRRRVELHARCRDHDGAADLAPARVGHGDDARLGDAAELRQRQLDLGGIDVLAAGDEHVLLAIDDVVVALVVAAHEIAGVEPARAAEGLAGGIGVAEVAERDHRAAQGELARLRRREPACRRRRRCLVCR